jgi:UDP-N-acetylglucosamine 2-epimerase (non-hydrolysing)
MRIACIVGARPNFIKIAPIMKQFGLRPDVFQPILIHTGQHYDGNLSDVFFEDLDIPKPDYNLGAGSGTQAHQTGVIMEGFDEICVRETFERVLVVGDVTSTMACAITAAKRGIPVVHVEAGLRSFDRTMPEEINRVLTDSVTDLFFVSEPAGVQNLLKEGHNPDHIKLVGNVMIDSLQANLDNALSREKWLSFGFAQGAYAVVTLHRPSNVDETGGLASLVSRLQKMSKQLPMIFPVHPRTAKNLAIPNGANRDARSGGSGKLKFCDPLGYLDFLSIICGAKAVITDSGGIQEETTALGVPCLTLRKNTERPITVELGTNTLVAHENGELESLFQKILGGRYKTGEIPQFWDGKTSDRIADELAGNGKRFDGTAKLF